jgi:hypothetical protein
VDRVGFERNNAIGEVRRSFQGGYGSLYQAAYLLGGLQLRSLRNELVDSVQMPEKLFHDEIMRQGSMLIAMLRLATKSGEKCGLEVFVVPQGECRHTTVCPKALPNRSQIKGITVRSGRGRALFRSGALDSSCERQ